MFHDNTKHFEVDGHAMKQKVESGEVTIEHVSTSEQFGHILTKVLQRTKFEAKRN
jgi:hypothetical protein